MPTSANTHANGKDVRNAHTGELYEMPCLKEKGLILWKG